MFCCIGSHTSKPGAKVLVAMYKVFGQKRCLVF